jgi:dipeptidase D
MNRIAKTALACIILLVLASAFLFPGCETALGDMEAAAPRAVDVDPRTLAEAALELCQLPSGDAFPGAVHEYLKQRADELGLESRTDESGNFIIEKPAAPGCESLPVTVLECPLGTFADDENIIVDEQSNTLKSLTGTLASAQNLGIPTILSILASETLAAPVRAVFMNDLDAGFSASVALENAFGDASIIGFSGTDGLQTYLSSLSAKLLQSEKDILLKTPDGKYAYVVAASGYPQTESVGVSPIAILSDILTTIKASGLYFELASFEAQAPSFFVPKEATAIIVVDDYEKKRFASLFDTLSQKYLRDLPRGFENVSLQIIETRQPGTVLSDEDAGSLVAWLYGISHNGTLSSNSDGANPSPVCINRVQIRDGVFSCSLSVSGETRAALSNMIGDLVSIGEFTGMPLKTNDDIPGFQTEEGLAFVDGMRAGAATAPGGTNDVSGLPGVSELGVIAKGNPEAEIVSLGWDVGRDGDGNEFVDLKDIDGPAEAVLAYLSALAEPYLVAETDEG